MDILESSGPYILEIRTLHWQGCHPAIAWRRPLTSGNGWGVTLQQPPDRMNIAVLPPCHRPPISWPSPSDRDIAKVSLKCLRRPWAQIHCTAAGLLPQWHPPTSAATARCFGDVFAMPHLHIRHRQCPKNFKGVVKTCDAQISQHHRSAIVVGLVCRRGMFANVCKWGRQLIGKDIARNVTPALYGVHLTLYRSISFCGHSVHLRFFAIGA